MSHIKGISYYFLMLFLTKLYVNLERALNSQPIKIAA